MRPFEESLRYAYPLDAESVVWDCGAYHGAFARAIAHRYGCTVHAFEPCRRFFEIASATCREFDTVKLHHFAVGSITRSGLLSVRNDSSGFYSASIVTEEANIIDVTKLLDILDAPPVIDLIKLNVEGCEYEILEALIDNGKVSRFKNIQVQFHPNVDHWHYRQRQIERQLLTTHSHEWGEDPMLHQSFTLK